jgi:hypothetical protein
MMPGDSRLGKASVRGGLATMRRCTRSGTLILVTVGISLALVAGAFGGQSGKEETQMANECECTHITGSGSSALWIILHCATLLLSCPCRQCY